MPDAYGFNNDLLFILTKKDSGVSYFCGFDFAIGGFTIF
jgi:hypothetical protein